MEKNLVNRVVAFDFDDTLAVTDCEIGARSKVGDSLSLEFKTRGIQFREGQDGWVWLDSVNYEKVQSASGLHSFHIEFDYYESMDINLNSLLPVHSMIKLMKESLDDPDTITIILTARAGHTEVWSPARKKFVSAKNREKISAFLNRHGMILPDNRIHTVGDVASEGGDTAEAKAEVLRGYAKRYRPGEVILYDDSSRNLKQVSKIAKSPGVRCRVTTKKVHCGIVQKVKHSHYKKGIKELLSSIFKCMLE